MCFFTTACGLSFHGSSKIIFYLFSFLEIIGVILGIAVTDKTQLKNIGYAWTAITLVRGLLLFISIIKFLFQLYEIGIRAFQGFSFWRTIFVVVSNLTYAIFFLEICTDGKALSTAPDIFINTSTQRLEFLISSLHTAMGIISGIGYSDIVPKIWYARLMVLPYFLFVFVVNGTIIAAFNEFASDHIKRAKKQQHATEPIYQTGTAQLYMEGYAPRFRAM